MDFEFEAGMVSRLGQLGAAPAVFYDIGAAEGSWSRHLSGSARADARFELFEPLADLRPGYRASLVQIAAQLPNMGVHRIGLGAANATMPFAMFKDGYSSSFIDIPGYDQIEA